MLFVLVAALKTTGAIGWIGWIGGLVYLVAILLTELLTNNALLSDVPDRRPCCRQLSTCMAILSDRRPVL